MAEEWNSYFCNVNGSLASIFLDLGLRRRVPLRDRKWLLWVWVHFKNPRPDGLSASDEAPTLFEIENKLTDQLQRCCGAILSGRITTEGRREFYYYGKNHDTFRYCVADVLNAFHGYPFDVGVQEDPEWNQYLNVLYPSDEELQKIKNREVLDVLGREGDDPTVEREVSHWLYFETESERDAASRIATGMGYEEVQKSYRGNDNPRPFGLVLRKSQTAAEEAIDAAVVDLFRLAKSHSGEYDGWETSVEKH